MADSGGGISSNSPGSDNPVAEVLRELPTIIPLPQVRHDKAVTQEEASRAATILRLKAEGVSNRQIAETVGMSESGVRGVLARSK